MQSRNPNQGAGLKLMVMDNWTESERFETKFTTEQIEKAKQVQVPGCSFYKTLVKVTKSQVEKEREAQRVRRQKREQEERELALIKKTTSPKQDSLEKIVDEFKSAHTLLSTNAQSMPGIRTFLPEVNATESKSELE